MLDVYQNTQDKFVDSAICLSGLFEGLNPGVLLFWHHTQGHTV